MHHLRFCVILIIFMLNGLATSLAAQTDSQPNIIFIMSDDHAFQAISAYDSSLI